MNEDVAAAVKTIISSFQEAAANLQEIRGRHGVEAWQGSENAVKSRMLHAALTDGILQIGKEYALGEVQFGAQFGIGDVTARSPLLSFAQSITAEIDQPIKNAKTAGEAGLDLNRVLGLVQYFHRDILRILSALRERMGPPILNSPQAEYQPGQNPQYQQYQQPPSAYPHPYLQGYAGYTPQNPQMHYQGYYSQPGYANAQTPYYAQSPYQSTPNQYQQYPLTSYQYPPMPSQPMAPTPAPAPAPAQVSAVQQAIQSTLTSPVDLNNDKDKKGGFGRLFSGKKMPVFSRKDSGSKADVKQSPEGRPQTIASQLVAASIPPAIVEVEDPSSQTATQLVSSFPPISPTVPSQSALVPVTLDQSYAYSTQPPKMAIYPDSDPNGPLLIEPDHAPGNLSNRFSKMTIYPDTDPNAPVPPLSSSPGLGRSDTRSTTVSMPQTPRTDPSIYQQDILSKPSTILEPVSPDRTSFGGRNSYMASSTFSSPAISSIALGPGIPSKANNYFGFCKNAWKTRENSDKAFEMVTTPVNVYSSRSMFKCKECRFEGKSGLVSDLKSSDKKHGSHFSLKLHSHKHSFDPIVQTHQPTGIKYRWLFLAKSHVKQKTEKPLYGCIFCVERGRSTSIHGTVDTLLEHVGQVHVQEEGGIPSLVAMRTRCISAPSVDETDLSWDIFIPTT